MNVRCAMVAASLLTSCQHFEADPNPRLPTSLTPEQKRAFQPQHAAFDLELERLNQRLSPSKTPIATPHCTRHDITLKESNGSYQVSGAYTVADR